MIRDKKATVKIKSWAPPCTGHSDCIMVECVWDTVPNSSTDGAITPHGEALFLLPLPFGERTKVRGQQRNSKSKEQNCPNLDPVDSSRSKIRVKEPDLSVGQLACGSQPDLRLPPHPRLWWFDFAHHPELVEGRDFQPNRLPQGRRNLGGPAAVGGVNCVRDAILNAWLPRFHPPFHSLPLVVSLCFDFAQHHEPVEWSNHQGVYRMVHTKGGKSNLPSPLAGEGHEGICGGRCKLDC
jgi:hypothetical protein